MIEELFPALVAKFLAVWVILKSLADEFFVRILLAYLSIRGPALSAVCLNKLPMNKDCEKF